MIVRKIVKKVIRTVGGKLYVKNIFLNTLGNSPLCPLWLRRLIYRLCGHIITTVFSSCFLGEGPGKLRIGKGTYCNHCCFFDLGGDITIGKNCCIAMRVSFINGTHEFGNKERRGGKGYVLPIVVEDGCWIGAGVTILPGVTVKKGCIIASGALVNKDCEENGLYAGVPAKRIRELK